MEIKTKDVVKSIMTEAKNIKIRETLYSKLKTLNEEIGASYANITLTEQALLGSFGFKSPQDVVNTVGNGWVETPNVSNISRLEREMGIVNEDSLTDQEKEIAELKKQIAELKKDKK